MQFAKIFVSFYIYTCEYNLYIPKFICVIFNFNLNMRKLFNRYSYRHRLCHEVSRQPTTMAVQIAVWSSKRNVHHIKEKLENISSNAKKVCKKPKRSCRLLKCSLRFGSYAITHYSVPLLCNFSVFCAQTECENRETHITNYCNNF